MVQILAGLTQTRRGLVVMVGVVVVVGGGGGSDIDLAATFFCLVKHVLLGIVKLVEHLPCNHKTFQFRSWLG